LIARHRRLISRIIVVLVFAALTLAITYPVVVNLDSGLAQNPRWSRDAFHHAYVLWWFRRALVDLGTNPAGLEWVHYPHGADYPLLLTYATVYAPGILLSLFLSPVATYNVVFLLTFFLSGLTGYALCAGLTRNRWAGLLGGIVYAFYPGRVAHALAGHLELISTYLFPLYLLLLVRTVRTPRLSTGLLCGLALAGSLLVQPLYVPYLLVPITVIWLLCETALLRHRVEPRAWRTLALSFGLAALIAAPLYGPALRQQLTGRGTYLEDIGAVRFSADLMGVIAPSPVNPALDALGLVPPYARRVAPPDWRIAELLTYVGLVPLALGVLAAARRRRRLAAWTLVAVLAAVLSLGPVLKVNGEVVTFAADGVEGTIALPYGLLVNLPLLSLNRAPARINATLMLALAVLAAHGLAWLTERIRGRWQAVVPVVLCLAAIGEMLVIWPCPITPVPAPAALDDLSRESGGTAVLNLPLTAGHVKEVGLFYQTEHEHPVFDSWFQRSLPVFPDVAGFLDGLLYPETEQDIVPAPEPGARAAVARAEGAGYVIVHSPYVARLDQELRLLETELGPPRSVEEGLIVYEVAPDPPSLEEPVFAVPNNDRRSAEHGWHYVEEWDGKPARWMAGSAELYVYSPVRQEGALQFTALPAAGPQRLEIEVNQAQLAPLVIGERITYTTTGFTLQPGLNQFSLRALGGCTHFVGDPRCSGVSLAVSGAGDSGCSHYIESERCLGVLFQDVRFLPTATAPGHQRLDVALGERMSLLGFDLAGRPEPGACLSLALYWQAVRPVAEDYTIFVHLLGEDGTLLAQHDAPPVRGIYPTSDWVGGDVFTHRASLCLPGDAPAGRFELLAGMYSYPDLVRLPVAGDRPYARDGLVWLQSVEIRP
jgi:hypothetical protein